jgi:hypothetical protein
VCSCDPPRAGVEAAVVGRWAVTRAAGIDLTLAVVAGRAGLGRGIDWGFPFSGGSKARRVMQDVGEVGDAIPALTGFFHCLDDAFGYRFAAIFERFLQDDADGGVVGQLLGHTGGDESFAGLCDADRDAGLGFAEDEMGSESQPGVGWADEYLLLVCHVNPFFCGCVDSGSCLILRTRLRE